MPKLTFGRALIQGNLSEVVAGVSILTGYAHLTSIHGSKATFAYGNLKYLVKGSGFGHYEEGSLTQGTIKSVSLKINGTDAFSIKEADLSIPVLRYAFAQEASGHDKGAIEALLTGLDWEYVGTNQADSVPQNVFSVDQVRITLNGDDVARLKDGDDDFFFADGDDRGYGDRGSDTLLGGRGDDTLFGGSGNDSLEGEGNDDALFGNGGHDVIGGADGNDVRNAGAGDDLMFGDSGRDRLIAGKGADTLLGGTGADTLSGGKGADVFVFERKGHGDVITDFELGRDDLVIAGSPQLKAHATNDGTLIYWDQGSVELLHVALKDVDLALL